MNINDLKGKKIAFAGSGGLDSCTITRLLTDYGVRITCFTADLAQPDEESMDDIRKRMLACGAEDFVLLDAKAALAKAGMNVIQAQAQYEGEYWNTTGIARHVLVQAMVPEMRKRGIDILSHGATGRGNDQVRFQLAANMLAPDITVYAPWRDDIFLSQLRGRAEMIDFCESRGLPIRASRTKPYSTDANALGLTHEAGVLESMDTPSRTVKPEMGVYPEDAPNKAERFTVRFERGWPVEINGKKVDTLEALLLANQAGGRYGVGIGLHVVENRFVGIKSRGVYEAPGMELLGKSYRYLQQLVLDRRAFELSQQLSLYIGKQIYQGYWFDLGTQMAMEAIGRAARLMTGTVSVSLCKGNVLFDSIRDVPHSLYSEVNASMEAVGSYDHADSEGFLRVLAVSAKALAAAKQAG
jgi:argininosuccinate synthase